LHAHPTYGATSLLDPALCDGGNMPLQLALAVCRRNVDLYLGEFVRMFSIMVNFAATITATT